MRARWLVLFVLLGALAFASALVPLITGCCKNPDCCEDDSDCPAWAQCDEDDGCVARPCNTSADCPSGSTCHDGQCRPLSSSDADGDLDADAEPDADGVTDADADAETREDADPVEDADVDDGAVADADGDGATCDRSFESPGLDDAAPWTLSGGAAIDGSASGAGTPGAAIFDPAAICAGGSVSQAICVGSYEEAGPLLLAVQTWTECLTASCGRLPRPQPAIAMGGGAPQPVTASESGFAEATVCLGEAGYGDPVVFAMTVGPSNRCASEAFRISFDDIELRGTVPSICAPPGTVFNGDLELGETGWTSEEGGLHEVIDDAGSLVGHLAGAASTCESPRYVVSAAPPLVLANAAVRFRMRGIRSQALRVSFRGAPSDQTADFVSTMDYADYYLCIDSINLGTSFQLLFETITPATCAGSIPRDFHFDDVELVSEPRCM